MKARYALFVLAAFAAATAAADTIHLQNGVRFDGVVTERPDGTLSIQAGNQQLVCRPSEIARIEKNDRTGLFDAEEARQRWAVRDAELTRLTGLTAEQRRQVKRLMYALKTPDAAQRLAVRKKLLALQEEMDVYRFVAYHFPELSPRLSPWVLETLFYLDTGRAKALLRENTEHEDSGTRAMAIELLGRMRDAASTPVIARGLVDHENRVVLVSVYALANMGARESTPGLIEMLTHPDRRVSNASREGLAALWQSALSEEDHPQTVSDWTAVWEKQKGTVQAPIKLASLSPLVKADEEFEDE